MTEKNSTGISRRTLAKGVAWTVPAVAVSAAAPAYASSPGCTPTFTPIAGSFKCCNGQPKNMNLRLRVTDSAGCIATGAKICVTKLLPSNGGSVDITTFGSGGNCTVIDSQTPIEVFLGGVSNCGVNLTVYYTVDDGPVQTAEIQSENISSGNVTGECSDTTTTTSTTAEGTTTTTTTAGTI